MLDKEKIAKFKIVEGLNADEIDNILSMGQEVACQDTEIIFEDSRISSDFFILLEGRVSVEIDVSHMEKNRPRFLNRKNSDMRTHKFVFLSLFQKIFEPRSAKNRFL